jgi:hypothetical protein
MLADSGCARAVEHVFVPGDCEEHAVKHVQTIVGLHFFTHVVSKPRKPTDPVFLVLIHDEASFDVANVQKGKVKLNLIRGVEIGERPGIPTRRRRRTRHIEIRVV